MKSKKALLMIIPMCASISLVACGNTPTTTSTPNATTQGIPSSIPPVGDIDISSIVNSEGVIQTPTTISLWSTTGQATQPALERYIAEFTASQPNVTVNNVYQSGSYSDLKTLVTNGFSANNFPNLVVAYPDHVADYLDYGRAVDLTQLYNDPIVGLSAADEADYIASFMSEGSNYAQAGIYSLPWCKSTELMYYNEELLIGLNLAPYDATINNGNVLTKAYIDSLTWEELFDKLCPAIEKYNAANDNRLYNPETAAILGYDSDDNLFITLAEQYGYGYTSVNQNTGRGSVDFDNPEMRALLEKFHEAAKKKYLFTKGTNNNNYVNTVFTTGACVFSIGSTGGVNYQFSTTNPMQVAAAPIPQAAGKDKKCILQGPSMTVLNRGNDAEIVASWLLWKTLTNENNALDWSLESGYMGVRNSVYESSEYITTNTIAGKPLKSSDRLLAYSNTEASKVIDFTFTSPVFVGSADCRTAAGGLLTQCLISTSWTNTGAALTTYIANEFSKAANEARLSLPA